jgi:hypothetical protein
MAKGTHEARTVKQALADVPGRCVSAWSWSDVRTILGLRGMSTGTLQTTCRVLDSHDPEVRLKTPPNQKIHLRLL